MRQETLYKIRGLPADMVDKTIPGSQVRVDKIKQMVRNMPDEAIRLFTYGQIGGLIPLLDDKYGSSQVLGVSYREYFSSTFKETTISIPNSKVVVLYDVGLEKALNLDFSSRVLLGLMKILSNKSQHLILNSEVSYSEFKRKYGISFANVLNMPKDEELKLDI